MRPLIALLSVVISLSLPLTAATTESDVMRLLLGAKTKTEFDSALKKAHQADLGPQVITEGKLLFGIRTQDTEMLTSLLPDLNILAPSFSTANSISGMNSVEQLRGMISYVKALRAMEERDEPSFRENITDAFWNFPQQGELFGQAVEQFQLKEKMQRWALDFTLPLLESGGKETTLGNVMGSQKVLVLIFWASNNQPSLNVLRSADGIAAMLKPHNIPLACVNVDRTNAEENAEKFRTEFKPQVPWLIETGDRLLTTQIEITSLPRAVVISQQGRVIFHGHPLENSLWRVLKRYAPRLNPPGEK